MRHGSGLSIIVGTAAAGVPGNDRGSSAGDHFSRGSSPPVPLSRGSSPPVPFSRGSSPPVPLSRGSSPPVPLSRGSSPPVPFSLRGRGNEGRAPGLVRLLAAAGRHHAVPSGG